MAAAIGAATAAGLIAASTASGAGTPSSAPAGATSTPIKHVVVIFDENVSYDHYFGTYPKAANVDGTTFLAAKNTPKNDNLVSAHLLASNPNLYAPKRLSPSQALTCDQDHNYTAEQRAADNGLADLYVQNTSVDTCAGGLYGTPGLVMNYYDGNTVTALWNYAQHYALSDNSFGSGFGPSTPGALNLVAGQTHGFQAVNSVTLAPTTNAAVAASANSAGVGTVINDPDPAYDDCSDGNHTRTNNLAAGVGATNVGDLLNAKGVTWGWFQGGFAPTTAYAGPGTYAICGATHTNLGGATITDYSPHHNPFEYYQSTSNPHHLPPTSVATIGHTDQANHQYDLTNFNAALAAGNLPAVSFVKAAEYQDGHAGYSDPIDEQHWLVNQINALEQSPDWSSTAVVIAYDDSDGWYDHVVSPVLAASNDPANDVSLCAGAVATAGIPGGYLDRCGPGPRLPLLVISPYARPNYIDHTATEQASITRFIEDNWGLGRIGDSSFDARAGSLDSMFVFRQASAPTLILNQDGSIRSH